MTDRREQEQYLQRLREQQRRVDHFQPQHLRQHEHHHQHRYQHQHHQHFEHPSLQQLPRQFHNRHFQSPYDGMNNFYRDSWQDNYYHDRYHQHHHRHHRDRDDFIPRMLEGILGEIMDGSLFRELDKLKVDGKQAKAAEDLDNNDRLERAAFRVDTSPDRQASENLDFSPQGQTSGMDHRFERTG